MEFYNPSRELDALVHEHVFNLPITFSTDRYYNGYFVDKVLKPYVNGQYNGVDYDWVPVPVYSSSLVDSLTLVGYLIETYSLHIRIDGDVESWTVSIASDKDTPSYWTEISSADNPKLQVAICNAILGIPKKFFAA